MNAKILQDKLTHQLRLVDAEALETRARRLESYIFLAEHPHTHERVKSEIAELYARADRIRKSLEPKG